MNNVSVAPFIVYFTVCGKTQLRIKNIFIFYSVKRGLLFFFLQNKKSNRTLNTRTKSYELENMLFTLLGTEKTVKSLLANLLANICLVPLTCAMVCLSAVWTGSVQCVS